jgi:hypothetical protein
VVKGRDKGLAEEPADLRGAEGVIRVTGYVVVVVVVLALDPASAGPMDLFD